MLEPLNRYIHIKTIEKKVQKPDSNQILLPENYIPKDNKYAEAEVVAWSEEVRFANQLRKGQTIIVDKTMIETVEVNDHRAELVLDNYILGLITS
tara:strand:- start:1586 stop:1870 length:285 start_codon:yes stop_codon:yes gene_type:complete